MTLATIRSQVKTKLRIGTATDNLLSDTVLTGLVNEALRKVTRERSWPWLLTSASVSISTSGVASLPTDFTAAHSLLYGSTDPAPIPFVGFTDLLGSKGAYVWSENGTQIQVEPAPTATTSMTLWYYQREEALSADGDTPIMPTVHDDIVAIWAAHLGALIRKDYDHAAALEREYRDELMALDRAVFRKAGGGLKVAVRRERTTSPARW